MKKNFKKIIATVGIFLLPMVVSAQQYGAWCDGTDCSFKQFVQYATETLFRPVVTLLISLTVVYFLWGTAQYIGVPAADKRIEGRKKMFISLIALAVMMSFWGLARILRETFF